MTVEEKAYNYASKVVKNRLTASEVAAHYGRGYIEGQEDMKQLGWHSASESPIVPEHNNWISVVAIVCDMDDNSTRATDATFNKDKGWIFPEFSKVLYWCYRPKED